MNFRYSLWMQICFSTNCDLFFPQEHDGLKLKIINLHYEKN